MPVCMVCPKCFSCGPASRCGILLEQTPSACKLMKKWCPSCGKARETAAHMLSCNEVGRVKILQAIIDFVAEWLEELDTNSMVVTCVMEYARGCSYMKNAGHLL
jgi:hypothetical protein